MSKTRKRVLCVSLIIMALSCFHPIGRVIVKHLLPMGFGSLDLIGSALFTGFLVVLMEPWKWFKKKPKRYKPQKINKETRCKIQSELQDFVMRMAKADNISGRSTLPAFIKTIEAAQKRKQDALLIKFINYYGELAIKLSTSLNELSKHKQSIDLQNSETKITTALNEINTMCDRFIAKIIENDLIDINADVAVLGVVSNTENY